MGHFAQGGGPFVQQITLSSAPRAELSAVLCLPANGAPGRGLGWWVLGVFFSRKRHTTLIKDPMIYASPNHFLS